MPLQLLPMEERDLDVYQAICWDAFKDDFMALMYPNGYTKEAREWSKDNYIEDWRADPKKVRMMKVIDTDLSADDKNHQIIGVANWKFFLKDRSDEELEADKKKSEERGFSPDCDEKVMEAFFGTVAEYKQKHLGGRAHVLLNLLATHPEHHRRGIGAMHLKWGNEQAEKLGLPCYLEASPKGKPLYLRYGYEVVSDLPFDSRAWGHPKDLPHVCMLRPVKEANGHAS